MLNLSQSDCDPVRIAVEATKEICLLPAYPVPDWCERCAGAWSRAIGGRELAVSVGTSDASGVLVGVEMSGATDPALAAGASAPPSGSHTGAGFGWVVPPPVQTREPRTFRVSNTPHFPAWASSRRGQSWKRSDAFDLLVGLTPLPGARNRVLIVEIGLTESPAPVGPVLSRVLEGTLPVLAQRLIIAFGEDPIAPGSLLTTREQEVLEQLVVGRTVREIAEDLGRSPHTVHDHVKSLHRKFNASTRGELVSRALGFVPGSAEGHAESRHLQAAVG